MNPRILMLSDIDAILQFESARLALAEADPIARDLAAWRAPWRKEALEHYLPLGWSLGIWNAAGALQGYFLAQALLFINGEMQTLWLEHVASDEQETEHVLIDIASKMAREKHLQNVLFAGFSTQQTTAEGLGFRPWPARVGERATTKR